jgi:hypothetical protein
LNLLQEVWTCGIHTQPRANTSQLNIQNVQLKLNCTTVTVSHYKILLSFILLTKTSMWLPDLQKFFNPCLLVQWKLINFKMANLKYHTGIIQHMWNSLALNIGFCVVLNAVN